MPFDFARSIGDEYPDYVDDELGYRYHASEVISAAESSRLQRIRLGDRDRLADIEQQLDDYSDLERWALGRRHLREDRLQQYFDVVEPIVEGPLEHPALDYPEIFVDLARQRARNDRLEAAGRLVDRMESHWPELEEALPLLHAQTLLWANRLSEAHDAFLEALKAHEEDVDLRVETAEDFLEVEAHDYARQWLQRARRVAEDVEDDASLVDIELLERRLPDSATGEMTDSDRASQSPAEETDDD